MLLIVSFWSRSYVFCQYLKTMAGIGLRPSDVKRAFKTGGREGVRELFLDLIIREDLKGGPTAIPDANRLPDRRPPAVIVRRPGQFSIRRNVGTTSRPSTLRSTVAWRTSSERIRAAEPESARSWKRSTTYR